MLTVLDSLHDNLRTCKETDIATHSATRRKLYYDKQTLMSMRRHPLALTRPRGLPDIPDILLDKPTTDAYILDEGYQPTEGYFLPTTMFSPMKQKIMQPKQQKKVNKTVAVPFQKATDLTATDVPITSVISTQENIATEEILERENQFVDEVLEVSGKKGQPMENDDTHLLCDLCQSDGEHVKAEHYCPECNEFLCQICAKVHKKSRASKHHVLQDKHDMPTAKLSEFAELACTKHNGETIKYFCKNHDQGCCTLCITTEHNKCKFDYIEDIGRNYEESDEFKTCIQMIKDIEEQLKENIHKSYECVDIVRQNFEQVMTDINTFREVINKKVDDLEKATREEMMKVKKREIARLDTLTARCQSMSEELTKLKNGLDEIKKYKQRKQLVLSTRKGQTEVSAYVKHLKTISAELTVQPYSFVRNMDLLVSLNRQKDFGILSLPERGGTCYEEIAKPSRNRKTIPMGEYGKKSNNE